MVLVIQRQLKSLSRHLHTSIPKYLTLRAILVAMLTIIGAMLLILSIGMEDDGGSPDPKPGHLLYLVIKMIGVTASVPSILPSFILILLTRDWVLSHKATKTTDPNDGLPYDPTLPQRRWHPKISPYRITVFLTPLAIGTVEAVLNLTGSVRILIIVVIFIV